MTPFRPRLRGKSSAPVDAPAPPVERAQPAQPLLLPVQVQGQPKAKPAASTPKPVTTAPQVEPPPVAHPGDAQDTGNQDAREIVELWAELMEEQDREARVTDPRVAQVQAFMHKLRISKDELAAYLRWVFRADDPWPKFMRKPERPYLALDNLLRRAHLSAHLDTAMSWDTATGQGAYHGARFVAYYDGRAFT